MTLDPPETLGEKIVRSFDDAVQPKTEIIRWVKERLYTTNRENFMNLERKHSRAIRDVSKYIDEYEDLYESDDALFTNQRKAQFQADAYERLRNWRWFLFVPYYVVLGAIVFEGNTHFTIWLIYASFPLWVDWLVETLQHLSNTTSGILFS